MAFLLFSGGDKHLRAQGGTPAIPQFSRADAMAYAVLFRQINTYKRLTAEAAASGEKKDYLARSIRNRLKLNDREMANLQVIATAYETEAAPLRAKVSQLTKTFRERFPGNRVPFGADLTPPPQLAALQAQEDALASKYRDLLQNQLASSTFRNADIEIRSVYGNPAMSRSLLPAAIGAK